jgi:hypothetical protein
VVLEVVVVGGLKASNQQRPGLDPKGRNPSPAAPHQREPPAKTSRGGGEKRQKTNKRKERKKRKF